jgi:hypothetical protein
MTIKITTIVGEVTEIVEFSSLEDYAACVGLKMFLSMPLEDQTKEKELLDGIIESLAEAKKRGGVH